MVGEGAHLQRPGMDTRTALRGGERHTRRAENLLSGRAVAAGPHRLRHLRIRRISIHADAMAHEVCLDLPVAADLGPFLGDHRTSANPFDAPRRRPDGRRLQLVCGLVEQPEPDLHARGRVRIPLHPLDRLVGRAGERIRRLQQDRLEDDLARKRRGRMDGRQSMGRGQRRRLGGIIGR